MCLGSAGMLVRADGRGWKAVGKPNRASGQGQGSWSATASEAELSINSDSREGHGGGDCSTGWTMRCVGFSRCVRGEAPGWSWGGGEIAQGRARSRVGEGEGERGRCAVGGSASSCAARTSRWPGRRGRGAHRSGSVVVRGAW